MQAKALTSARSLDELGSAIDSRRDSCMLRQTRGAEMWVQKTLSPRDSQTVLTSWRQSCSSSIMQLLYLTASLAALILSATAAPVAPQAYSRPTNLVAAESSAQAYGNEKALRIVDQRDAGAEAAQAYSRPTNLIAAESSSAQAYGNEKALRIVDARDADATAAQAYGNEKALRIVDQRDAGAETAQAYGNEKALRIVDQRDTGASAAQAYGNEKASIRRNSCIAHRGVLISTRRFALWMMLESMQPNLRM